MEFAAVKSDTKCSNREASKFLGRCIDRCRALSDNNQLYTAKQIFALINLSRLSLPSATGQSQPCPGHQMIKKQCARQAEKHLEEYERSHSRAEGSPVAARVTYLMTRSELCFLKTDYTRAKDYACQALADAMKYGFELETVPAKNHLDHICRCCASITAQDKLQRVKDLSSSYNSSTTDSDQKYNVKSLQRAT
ncbi:hypothetical protein OS493_031902 [Desmophyllum pertusum]|uniref:Uncharacterized protein n=1 Tax=Desmophyllum pertusum TaxID=174260 RepID=A0A9W9ZXL4_9CNID|nr:hypothetical protein OS493_031902 [Desmophyllum pertusum]